MAARHAGGDLAAVLTRNTAKAMVMPISHDQFFPPHVCEADSRLVPGCLFRVIPSPEGHMGLNGFEPGLMAQVDQHRCDLMAT